MPSFVKISEIAIPEERQRKVFRQEKIRELAESIAGKALLHPIVINSQKRLVSGNRRYLAVQLLAEEGRAISCDSQLSSR